MSDVETSVSTESGASEAQSQSVSTDQADSGASQTPEYKGPSDIRSKLETIRKDVAAKAKEAPATQTPAQKVQDAVAGAATPASVPGSPAPAAASAAGIPAPATPPANAAAGLTPGEQAPYTPNFKYKFMGKEQEIPELLRGVIKDPESEKVVRELVEKSQGLDAIKPKFMEVQNEHHKLTSGLSQLDKHLERNPQTGEIKNLGKFASAFGLTDKDIFDYTEKRIKYLQADEKVRQQLDADETRAEQFERLQQENATLQQTFQQTETAQRAQQLDQIIAHPQISPVADRHPGGKAGFYRDVAQHAFVVEVQSGGQTLLTPEQAVLSYIQSRGLAAQAPAASVTPQTPAPVQQVATPAAQAQQEPTVQAPTLPKVPSQATSPAKKQVSSLKELKSARDRAVAAYG